MEMEQEKADKVVPVSHKSLQTASETSAVLKAWYSRLNSAKERGEFTAWTMIGIPYELLLSFDVLPVFVENYGPICAAKQVSSYFCEIAESEGFFRDLCSYLRIGLGYAAEYSSIGQVPAKAPWGGVPRPDMMIGPSPVCDGRVKFLQAAQRYWDVPYCCYEALVMPFHVAASHDKGLKRHYTKLYYEQLKTVLIPFLGKNTNKRFNESRLSETLALDIKQQQLFHAATELLKAHPAPYLARDSYTMCAPSLVCRGTEEAVDYYQRLYDEVKYRVEHKIGANPNEQYRIFWMDMPPWYHLGILDYFESRNATTLTQAYVPGAVPEPIDLNNPLETIAKKMYEGCWYGGGNPWGSSRIDRELRFVREYHVDGVVMLTPESCRRFSIGHMHSARLMKEELDLPILDLRSDMADKRFWSDQLIKENIDAFLEIIEYRKS
jgi:benzoyl-CoA reductase/2-hydroxyglutaryl-CoA dehydratase subunit BcrC/BadD/HgdB